MSRRRALLLAWLCLLLQPLPASAQEKILDEWQLILLAGKRVGTQHQLTWMEAQGLYRTEIYQKMVVSRLSRSFAVSLKSIWIEDDRFQSVEAETDMNGQRETLQARAEEEGIRITQARQGRKSESLLPAGRQVVGPYGATRLIAAAVSLVAAGGGSAADSASIEVSYSILSPETARVEQVKVRIFGLGELQDSRGRKHRGVLAEEESSGLPGIVSNSVYDEQGQLVFSVTPLGVALEIVQLAPGQSPAHEAEAPAGDFSDLQLFDVTSLRIPVQGLGKLTEPLSRLDAAVFRFSGAAVRDLQKAVEAALSDLGGEGYRIIQPTGSGLPGQSLVLAIETPPPPADPMQAAGKPGGYAQYTGDGFYLNLDDPRLEQLLKRCAPVELSCLETLVHSFISNKSLQYGFAGVEEVLDTRTGDCTEHSLLLTALLRKLGLPARQAYGFILTEAGFIGHAWTEVFVEDRWHWLDPSFPGGVPYRLKLRLGVLDPAQPVWSQMGLSLLTVAGSVKAELLEGLE